MESTQIRKKRSCKGYTLVELMAVIAIMAALAAVKNVSGKTTFSNGKWACPPFFVFIRPYSCIEAMNIRAPATAESKNGSI